MGWISGFLTVFEKILTNLFMSPPLVPWNQDYSGGAQASLLKKLLW